MTQEPFHISQETIDEVAAVAAHDAEMRQRDAFINNIWVDLYREVVGRLDTLPLWAQSYIKALRAELWDAKR